MPEEFSKGDYVLASKYHDGDTGDQYAVGFYDSQFDTNVHRRIKWIKVDMADLLEAAEYARADLVPCAVSGFFLSGSLWAAVGVIASEGFGPWAFALGCIAIISGASTWWFWKRLEAPPRRIQRIIASIENEEEVK